MFRRNNSGVNIEALYSSGNQVRKSFALLSASNYSYFASSTIALAARASRSVKDDLSPTEYSVAGALSS